ncbi:AraC-like DNA-binding protein [Aliiruegeria haliotis]|uniref:AraC-like DNA-binding protein n=1 Tax=Aliiruegeria haliotis TaxID=1280846 RepID=A0A2T0RJ93_9RHOB|nr:AraC family transcriptional regulator [Aliiruegeria haliotis]PRY21264.1 AraC-like DNA-binding protein [Aliiruegeria haliotis]
MGLSVLTHNAVRTRELINDLSRKGYPTSQLLADAGIRPQELESTEPFLPFEKIAAIWEASAEMTGDDLLGFRRGQTSDMRLGGLITYFGMASPTLADLIRNVARYRRVFSDAIELDTSDLDSRGILTWHFRVPTLTRHRQNLEFNSASLTTAARKLTGRDLHPLEVTFNHPRNEHVQDFDRFFGCAVAFGAERNMIRFRDRDLELPLLTADDRLHDILQNYCEEILRRKRDAPSNLVSQVERLAIDRLTNGTATQDAIANELAMSKRTLARRLAEEGTKFQLVIENLRQALARDYIKDSDLSLTEIAFLLGYRDASSFSTAFRRWTGKTPSQMRAEEGS